MNIDKYKDFSICKAFEIYNYIESDLETLNITVLSISYKRFLKYKFLENLKGHIEFLPLPINDMCNHKICKMKLE